MKTCSALVLMPDHVCSAALLVDVSQSKESLPEAVDTLPRSSLPPHPAYAKNQEEVATGLCAYQKLSEEIPGQLLTRTRFPLKFTTLWFADV